MMYVRFPLSLRNVEDLLHERGIDICHETIRYWWNKFGPLFAGEISKKRMHPIPKHSNWKWHLDEVFVKINGETHYLWRAVDHEGEVLETFVSKGRDRKAALDFLKRILKKYGAPKVIVTDRLKSYRAAMKISGNEFSQEVGRWKNNRCENSHLLFRRREYAILRRVHIFLTAPFGEVGAPGRFAFTENLTFLDILSDANGPSRNADLRNIRISHHGEKNARFSKLIGLKCHHLAALRTQVMV